MNKTQKSKFLNYKNTNEILTDYNVLFPIG